MPSLSLPDVDLYYRLEGRDGAPRLLLLHPVGADHSLWDAVVPELSQHFQILRPDLRGHGGSKASSVPNYDVALLASDILGLCDALGWDRFAACGVSIGGMTVLQMAATAPHRLSSAILCSAAAHMAGPPGGWQPRIDAVRAEGLAPLAQGMVERMFSERHRATNDPLIDTLRTVFLHTNRIGYAASLAALRDADLRPILPAIATPVLLVTGGLDALIPADAIETLETGLVHATRVTLDTGHFPPVEAPAAFAETVRSFLTKS